MCDKLIELSIGDKTLKIVIDKDTFEVLATVFAIGAIAGQDIPELGKYQTPIMELMTMFNVGMDATDSMDFPDPESSTSH